VPTSTPSYENLSVQRIGRVGVITLDRPHVLNAFSDDSVREAHAAVLELDRDDDVLVIVLRGNGRAFSSGADVRQRQLRPEHERREFGSPEAPDAMGRHILQGLTHWKPAIAAVHGYAIGMALGLVMECEIVVAEAGTRFQITEISRGLGGARYWELLRMRGGGAWADEIGVTGRFFEAEEAFAHGVINAVAEEGQAFARAMEYAELIMRNPPLSARATVAMRRAAILRSAQEADTHIDPLQLHLTEDFQESARAAMEKRPPAPYQGR
jgi:enoyl-CoA hydratase/carnithine racemase